MSKRYVGYVVLLALWVIMPARMFGQSDPAANKAESDRLVAVLKSDAPHEEKADACRQLATVGTSDAIAPLAALLGDEKLSHMARYALEPIADPRVDDALRGVLGQLKGRPLVGVIGSIGVRRDGKAVEPLAKLLKDSNADVAQTAARSLGRIGTSAAAKALVAALAEASAANKPAVCEGLLRCADALAAGDKRDEAVAIYDRLRDPALPSQVQAAALRGAIIARQQDGVPLLQENLKNKEYALFAAACQAAQEMPGEEVTKSLTAALESLPADNQVLVIQTLGKRADATAAGAILKAAQSGEKPVRIAAIRNLAQIGEADLKPALVELSKDSDPDVAKAAEESLAAFHSAAGKAQKE